MALQLSCCADYALRAVLEVAERTSAPVAEIARRRRVPPAFLAKVVRDLVRAGILRSTRGPGGGLTLGRPSARLTLLEVLEAVDGPVALNRCVPGGGGCPLMRRCPARDVWLRLQRVVTDELRAVTVAGLSAGPPGRSGPARGGVRRGAAGREGTLRETARERGGRPC